MTAEAEELNKKKDKEFEVVINGTETPLDHDTVTYAELGELAFPGHDPAAMFTVTYRHAATSHGGKADGTLVAGESVSVKKKGTTFNVRLTTRS
ncbi:MULTISPECIES: multiubiquitin domain-containing protein [Mycobacterium avium complex (MAC)]|uniref:multiubiquitin domain-containing protein n=1 Tax=Mycobacterium avium complex (MAC) TaxID=120793 RepID=UPI0007A0D507|nr:MULTISPECIES: multiubiquitin domain-containing protein [Mycobacterium avium complex (MAC)]MCA2250814.1 multiubiquitin domain-containing protein [Mycobacterium intracellulare]MDV3219413.1 multiubiquitin domain-containing protein [Mycobacterium avium]